MYVYVGYYGKVEPTFRVGLHTSVKAVKTIPYRLEQSRLLGEPHAH